MRLRIAHQLSLLLAGAVVLAVAISGALVLWNLRSGFGDYMRARDSDELGRLVQILERRSNDDPDMNWLRGSRAAMESVLSELSGEPAWPTRPLPPPPPDSQPDAPPRRGEGPPAGRPDGPPPRMDDFGAGQRPPPPPRQRPPERGIGGRVQIYDSQDHWLAGRAQPVGPPVIVRAVKVKGAVIGNVRLNTEPDPEGLDARFMNRQVQGLALAGAATVLLALLVAFAVARRWSRPLRELQEATAKIAGGDLSVRIRSAGAFEIAALMDDVNHMSSSLARLENARRIWIAQISHELRTPLAVLRGEIEAIEDGARQPSRELMASLRDEVLQLTRMVNDLHLLSVADLQGLPCEFIAGDADACLARVAQRYVAKAAERMIALSLPAQRLPMPAHWDFGRIEQLLTNLLDNSLRYTDAPGRIQVAWQVRGAHLELRVEDSAPGVPSDDLTQLFEPLFRVDRARQRSTGQGSGLGLSIVRAIVTAHGGSVHAEACALGGLALVVELPLRPPAKA